MGRVWGSVAVAALVLAAVGFAQTRAGSAILQDAGVSGRPPGYTSLSFATPKYLPTQLYSQEALLPADFIIRNESRVARQYRWQVVEIRRGRDRQIASGVAALASGASTSISLSFVSSCVGGKIGIAVRLTAPRESIDFWSVCMTTGMKP
jgi:hypothetical protein